MRPERSRETGRAPRVARARLLVKADLAWLGGYPAGEPGEGGLPWSVPPGAGRPERSMVVDRASLHRATRALTELELRFGDVLEDVVGSRRAWTAGARAAIELLKPALRGELPRAALLDAPLATGLFRADAVAAVRAAPSSLRPLLGAAVWIALVQPGRLGAIVHFVLAHGDAVAALRAAVPPEKADTTALHLALLAEEEGAKRVEPLARLLSSRALYAVPTLGVEYARALSKEPRGKRPPRPVATLGPALATWTTAVLAAEAHPRRRALALLGALDLAPAAAEWATWWSRVERCERLALSQPETDDDARARAKAGRLAERSPRPLRGESLTSLLDRTLAWPDALHREATRALAELPALDGGVAVRLAFLEHWSQLAEDARPAALSALLGAFGRYLVRTRPHAARLLPWARILDRERRPVWSSPPDDDLLDDVPAARWPAFYEALARAVEDGAGHGAPLCQALVAVLPHEPDAAHALALARALVPHVGRVSGGTGLREILRALRTRRRGVRRGRRRPREGRHGGARLARPGPRGRAPERRRRSRPRPAARREPPPGLVRAASRRARAARRRP